LTEEGYRDFHVKNHELSQPQYKVIKINADLKKAGKKIRRRDYTDNFLEEYGME